MPMMDCMIKKELTIETMRALAAAANSLRFNPELDPDIAFTYEEKVHNLRHLLGQALNESPNEPLTLDELRQLDGEPVWIERIGGRTPYDSGVAVVSRKNNLCRTVDGCNAFFELYGTAWLAYRRKEDAHHGP